MKRIVLCADDYGQAPAISQGIRNLILNGRLTATSCMVNTPFWSEHAKWLGPYKTQVDVGLHFNLTEGKALSNAYIEAYGEDFLSLSGLMRKAFFRQLNQTVLEAELNAQLDHFTQALGGPPSFIDGHQHVHQFPIVRDALLNVYERRLRAQKTYIRLVTGKVSLSDLVKDLKKIIIFATGAKALKRILLEHKIPHNQSFAGIYAFSQTTPYRSLFSGFLSEIGNGGVIMCHPGLSAPAEQDLIAKARYEEYQYFTSNQFLVDCGKKGVTLERFKGTSIV